MKLFNYLKNPRWFVLLLLAVVLLGSSGCTAEYKKTRALKRGETHFQAGAYEKARIEFLNVLKREPQNQTALQRICTIYFERGQLRAAYPFLVAARKLDPNNAQVAFQLGSTYLSAGDFPKAREQALFVLSKQPMHEEALLLLAETALDRAQLNETTTHLDRTEKQHGPAPAIFLARNSLFMKQKNTAAAEQAVVRAYQINTNSPMAMVALGALRWSQGNTNEANALLTRGADLSPARSTRRLRLVEFKMQTGAVDEAKEMLRSLTEKMPDHLPALAYLARLAFAEKRYEDCLAFGQKILAFEATNYDALLLRGRIRMSEQKYAEALKDFERLKGIYAGAAEPRYHAGVAHLASEEIDKSIVNLNQALSVDPNYLPAVLLLAELNLRQGDPASAVQRLAPLVQRQPLTVQPYLLLAAAYRAQDRLDDVNAVYHKMTTLFPKEAEPYFLMGLTYRQQGRRNEARRSFGKAQEMNPKHVQSLNQLVDLDIGETNFTAAWKRLDAQVKTDPDSPDLRFLEAKLHVAQGNLTNAEVALSRVLELSPEYQPAYAALAQLYVESKQHEMALEKLNAGIARNPRDFVSLMKVAMIHEQLKDHSKAATTYETLLVNAPRFAPALNNLAYIYTERLPALDKAYQLAQKAREISPHDPFAADTLGWVLFKRGEYAYALKLIQECADRMPGHPDVLFHLGMAYYMTGAEDFALTALTKAVAAAKTEEWRVEAEARLAVLKMDLTRPAQELVRELDAVIEKYPKDIVAFLRLGGAHERLGEHEKARAIYERALKVNPQSVTAIMTLARLHAAQLGNQARALELAKNARSLSPENPGIVELLGPLAYQAQDFSWAQTLLEKSNHDRPNNPTTLYYLGMCYFLNGEIARAEQLAGQALRSSSFPEAAFAREFLVFAQLATDPAKAAQAEEKIKAALQAQPSYAPALAASAILHESRGQFTEAKQAYERLLRLHPESFLATRRLGLLSAGGLKDDRRGMELLAKVRQVAPKDLEVARALGILAARKGDSEWAVQLLKEVAAVQKPDAPLLFNLGIAQYRNKQVSDSAGTLRQAIALSANDPLAPEARLILTEIDKATKK